MSAPPAWTTMISSYVKGLNITDDISEEDFDYEFDDDFEPETSDEWESLDTYTPDIPLPKAE